MYLLKIFGVVNNRKLNYKLHLDLNWSVSERKPPLDPAFNKDENAIGPVVSC